jgi:NAD(P)-dependent dehydrogenase (short-subunit alcohol dehydrogenase family)
MNDLNNRVALVTGASRGIGAGIAIALASAGADVAVNYREQSAAAKSVCAEIASAGRKAIPVQADVSRAQEITRMVGEVESLLGPIDILVNNAAIAQPRPFEEITETEWDEILTVNLKSVFLVTQAVIAGMRKRKHAKTQVGTHYQSIVSGSANRGCGGSALCGIQGGNHRPDALLRFFLHQGWNHGECHRSRAD